MRRFSDAFLEKIKSKTDIVDLISSYVTVQRKGRDYWACCPFHKEKTPSFQIRSDHQFYRCYGCGKHGNIFNFLMEYENISFAEAVEILAKKAGLEIPEFTDDPEAKARSEQAEKIYNINKETAKFYYRNLFSENGAIAREYIAKRGLDSDVINTFGIGCSSDFESLPEYLLKKGYAKQSLIDAGVVSVNSSGKLSDFFGNRLIIPIIGGNGKVLGFTGRVLVSNPDFAKYKNTQTTLVFNKRKNLFGINLFKKIRQPSGVRSMILVEGHMDVVSLYQAGIRNAVASMGTSLTVEQCREIKRYADLVYVSFDGDSAGQNATLRGLDLLKNEGLDVQVVCLKDNMDPDDYVRKYGKTGYEELLDKAMPLIDYKLMKVEEKYNLNKSDDKIKYAKDAKNILNSLDEVEKQIYAEVVESKSGVKAETLIEDKPVINESVVPAAQRVAQENNAFAKAEAFVMSSFIYGKNYIAADDLPEIRKYITEEKYIEVFDYFMKGLLSGIIPKAADVFDILGDDPLAALLVDEADKIDEADQKTYYLQCMKKLKQDYTGKELRRLTTEFNNETDVEAKEKIRMQIKNLTKAQPK